MNDLRRGYVAWYRMDDGRLVLATLETGRAYDGAYLGVNAAATTRGSQEYRSLALPVEFTGRLLIGAGFTDIGRLHMGLRPAYGFARVWELRFDQGRLELAHDRTADLAVVRDRLADTDPGPAHGEEAKDWIRRSFSLSFDYSWPRSPQT
ncbi:hypothetical protein [Actinoplanes palleronii]|uniref:Uncharacterized protein n=1 Tax=Actinoplanes palleronii TaxID=113570 RepID=A0ABQ4BQU7_9ACTN|nr:hypothetical protein [Actinoplanes palleronii]GIE73043.1 hypothetical protein Apa02nite_091510 [Actinoplanes palleronii]